VKVVLNDRTDGLPPALKAYAERKLTRLERHFGKVADAVVDFSEEHKRFGIATVVCRINVHVTGRRTPVLSAHERGVDAQSAGCEAQRDEDPPAPRGLTGPGAGAEKDHPAPKP
jgi:ribosome-associated translation inhibitor RaiA